MCEHNFKTWTFWNLRCEYIVYVPYFEVLKHYSGWFPPSNRVVHG